MRSSTSTAPLTPANSAHTNTSCTPSSTSTAPLTPSTVHVQAPWVVCVQAPQLHPSPLQTVHILTQVVHLQAPQLHLSHLQMVHILTVQVVHIPSTWTAPPPSNGAHTSTPAKFTTHTPAPLLTRWHIVYFRTHNAPVPYPTIHHHSE